MQLVLDDDGLETWECIECGRMLHIRWYPFRKTVIIEGDTSVAHSGFINEHQQYT